MFCDSRTKVEELALALRALIYDTVMREEPDDRGGNEGDQDVDEEAESDRITAQEAAEHGNKLSPVEQRDGGDSAEAQE